MAESRKERTRRKAKVASARRAAENSAGKQSKAYKLPSGVLRFTPKADEYTVAILGYEAKAGNPDADEGFLTCCRRYWAHRGIGGGMDSYLCPVQTYGKPCPICDYRNELGKREGWKAKAVKALNASQRGLWLLWDRAEEKKGLQVMDISHYGFGDLLFDKIRRPKFEKYENFHDPDNGFDLSLSFKDEPIEGNPFIKISDIGFESREPIPDSILEQVFCLDDCLVCLEYAELKSIFESGVGTDEREEEHPNAPRSSRSDPDDNDDENEEEDDFEDWEEETPATTADED